MCYSHFHYSLRNPSLLSLLSLYLISLSPYCCPYSSLILMGFEVFGKLFPGDCWCVERFPHPFWSSGSSKSVLSAALLCSGVRSAAVNPRAKAKPYKPEQFLHLFLLKDTVPQPDFLLGITVIKVKLLGTISVPAFSSRTWHCWEDFSCCLICRF